MSSPFSWAFRYTTSFFWFFFFFFQAEDGIRDKLVTGFRRVLFRSRIHDKGVRDGLMLRMIGEVFGQNAAEKKETDPLAGARQFAASCGLEPAHGLHVARLSRRLFEQLAQPLKLPSDELVLLEAAAILHEVGNLINYQKHHKHSYHLILHGNLRGLSPKQRELVANIARYHRRAFPKLKHENFSRLQPPE